MAELSESERKRLRAEAERLLNEPLLVEALDEIMGEAFAEFKELDISPETLHKAIALQALVRATQSLVEKIDANISRSGARDGGFDPNPPTAQATSGE